MKLNELKRIELIRKELYPDEEAVLRFSGGLNLNKGLGIDH